MKSLALFLGLMAISQGTITTDNSCSCALVKGTTTTPNASTTATVGCSAKLDWTGSTTKWCLTDESIGTCGTFQPGFGYVDSCALANFTNINVQPSTLIEWDQTPTLFYTGQTMNITWDSQNIQQDEWVRIQYQGQSTRVLTSGSGVNITAKQFSTRLSDSSNMITNNPVPINLALPSTASITANSAQTISVLQSKITNLVLTKDNNTVASGNTLLCDNGLLTIGWRGLGQAQIGTVSVVVKSTGGGTTVGTAISGLNATGNMTVDYVLPRSFTPSGFANYAVTITVQEPGQAAYTLTSSSFKLSAAPSTSPTPTPTPSNTPSNTPTPTSSKTPTSSTSSTRTPTPSISASNTPTPSITPTQTPSPSNTETARPSIDYAAIARSAAESVDTSTPAIAGAFGTVAGIIVMVGAFKWYKHKQLTELRKKKQMMTKRFVDQATNMYGLDHHPSSLEPNIVMYTVQNIPKKPRSSV